MKSKSIQVSVPRRLGMPLCSLLLSVGGGAAHAHDLDRINARLDAFKDAQRAHRMEARELRQSLPGLIVPAPGEALNPPPTIDVSRFLNHSMSARNSRVALPGQVSAFRTTRPETSNRSTYVNDAGQSRALRTGVSLDLSSTDANISIGEKLLGGSTVTITVGDQTKEIKAGSQVTAAEYAALNQQLATGTQDLKLSSDGAAIDGSLNLNVVSDKGRTINTSALVIPESVEVTGDFGRHADGVRVSNDLVNYGSLFAVSSKANKNTALIGARDITNHEGGLITSDAPQAVTANSNLNLALRAGRDLNNAGEISSSGDLELSAGNSLTNSGAASARGSVSLNSSNVGNTGSVSAQNGNINILASVDSNLNIDSTGGTFSALNGNINIATTPDTNIKTDTTIEGGRWFAKEMNVSSGDGRFGSNFEDVTARVNASAGIVSLKSNGEALITGDINATGDPLIQNAVDVVLSGNIDSNGGPISIVAGRNISVGTAFDHISSTSVGGASGEIFMAAGVDFNVAGGILTITGASATGGSINLTDMNTLTSGDDVSGTTVAGTINLTAFEGSAPSSGRVIVPGLTSLRGSTTNGTLNVNGAATSGIAINFGNIDSNGTGSGGIITMQASTPSMGSPIQIAATGPNEGQVTGGFGPVAPSVGTSGIILGDVSAAGGNFLAMNLDAMGDITVNSFTSNSSTTGASVEIGSVTGGIEVTGAINIFSSDGSIGSTFFDAPAGTIRVGSINYAGAGAPLDINENYWIANSATPVEVGSISATALGTIAFIISNLGGDVELSGDIILDTSDNYLAAFGTNVNFSGSGIRQISMTSPQDSTLDITAGNTVTFSPEMYIDVDGDIAISGTTVNSNDHLDIFARDDVFLTGAFNSNVRGVNIVSEAGDIDSPSASISSNYTDPNNFGDIQLFANQGNINIGNLTSITDQIVAHNINLSTGGTLNVGTINTDGSSAIDGRVSILVSQGNFIATNIIAGSTDIDVENTTGAIQIGANITGDDLTFDAATSIDFAAPFSVFNELLLSAPSVNLNNFFTLSAAPDVANAGGAIQIVADSLTANSTIFLDASSPAGPGGSISVEVGNTSQRINANVNGASAAGSINIHSTGTDPLLINNLSADATNIFGSTFSGIVNVAADDADVQIYGIVSASSNSPDGTGGSISLTAANQLEWVNNAQVFANSGGNSSLNSNISLIANDIYFPTSTGNNSFEALGGVGSTISVLTTGGGVVTTGSNIYMAASGDINFNTADIITTRVFPSGAGDLGLNSGGTVTINSPIVTSSSPGNGGDVAISASGAISTSSIQTNAQSSLNSGGDVTLDSDTGAITVGAISTFGGSGGDVYINTQSSSNLQIGGILTVGENGPSGSISILNLGAGATGTIILTSTSYSAGALGGAGGSIQIVNDNGGITSPNGVSIDATGNTRGDIEVSVSGAFASGGGIDVQGRNVAITASSITNDSNNLVFVNASGNIDINGSITTTRSTATNNSSGVVLTSTGGYVSTQNITTAASSTGNAGNVSITSAAGQNITVTGNINASNSGTGTVGNVSLTSGNNLTVTGIISGGSLTVTELLDVDLTTNVQSLAVTATGQPVVIQQGISPLDIGSLDATSVLIDSVGDLTVAANLTGLDALELIARNGADIHVENQLQVNTNGSILLRTVNGGDIDQTGSGVVTVNGTGQLEVVLDGAAFGTATLTEANDVDRLSTGGGGTVDFNNGANSFRLLNVGNGQDFTASATAGILIDDNDIDNSNGTITLLTPNLQITRDVTAGSITVQNPNGTLTVTGGAGSSLNGLVPTPGVPGSPSSPTSILLSATNGGDVELNGDLAFTGDATFRALGGAIRSNNNSLFVGTNNIVLDADDWIQAGNGNITANNLILPAKGTIINTGGDVNINSNIIMLGHDLAIMASGNVNIASGVAINISETSGTSGNLTIIAGWSFVENSFGQIETNLPYTLNATSANSGDVDADGVNIITTNGTGDAGNVFIGANGGSVSVGNVSTGSTSGLDGNILLVGRDGVTAGNLSTLGGSATLSATNPLLDSSGVVTVVDGTLVNGEFTVGTAGNGGVTVNNVATVDGAIQIRSTNGNSVSITGNVFTGNDIAVASGQGNISFTNLNAISATPDSGGEGGSIVLTGNQFSGSSATMALTANGTTSGGFVNIDLIEAITLGTGGDFTISATGATDAGGVNVATDGNLIVNGGGLNLAGASGNGANVRLESLTTVTLNDVAFLDVDGTGTDGFGGYVEIVANQGLTTTGTIDNPTVVSANGIGAGGGGIIKINSGSVTPVFIGAPAKAPKGAAIFLELEASSGASGPNAGQIDIQSAGPITANSGSMEAVPGLTDSEGASFRLSSGGALIVTGDLDGRGTGTGGGGLIRLFSNNKKAFSVGTGKVPKNGVQGNIFGETLQIVNSGGGLLISQNLVGDIVSLQAGQKGTIATAKGITLEAGTLNLLSDFGAIGKKPLQIEAGTIEVFSLGAVNLFSTSASLNILNSTAGKGGFNLTHAGSLAIQGIEVTGGDIEITTNGTINATLGSEISASDGSITLVNSDTAGSIVISAGSTIETSGDKGGAVVIAIGEAPKKGVNQLQDDPPALDVQEVGKKGIAYYDGVSGGLVANGTNNIVFAENKPVILSNPNTGSGTITLGGNTTIHADPPVGVKEVTARSNFTGSLNIPQSMTLSAPVAETSTLAIETSIPLIVDQAGVMNGTALDTRSAHQTFASLDSNTQTLLNQTNSVIGVPMFGPVSAAGQQDRVGNSDNELFVDAKFVGGAQTHHVQQNGNAVYAPSTDITVDTKHGTVKIAANAVAVVMQSNDVLSVYDIDDHSKDAVVIETHGKQISLTPGLHATISNHASEQFEDVNAIELVQHRGLNRDKLNNGWKLYTSEFSIPSACFAVKPLREITGSNYSNHAKLRTRMMKTAAVIMSLRPDRGDYVQFFKSQRTAMK